MATKTSPLRASVGGGIAAVCAAVSAASATYFYLNAQKKHEAGRLTSAGRDMVSSTSVTAAPKAAAWPQPDTFTEDQQKILRYGAPRTHQLQVNKKYISLTDYKTRQPVWVLERLTNENLIGNASRKNLNFLADSTVPEEFRASPASYAGSGYHRGHMAPAADFKNNVEDMAETFFLNSNIVPQDGHNNTRFWNCLEMWTRNLIQKYGFEEVHVLTGPLYLPTEYKLSPLQVQKHIERLANGSSPNGQETLPNLSPKNPGSSLQTQQNELGISPPKMSRMPARTSFLNIGSDFLPVPTHLFKAVLARSPAQKKENEGPLFYASFVVPNAPISKDVPLYNFQVGHGPLQRVAGMTIFESAFSNVEGSKKLPGDLCSIKVMGTENQAQRDEKMHGQGTICDLFYEYKKAEQYNNSKQNNDVKKSSN